MSETKHTPGPWRYEPGGGHAQNSIRGSESIQVHGWPERSGGVSNASYGDMVCENLGDVNLPGPSANARLIAAAPDLLEACKLALGAFERNDCIDWNILSSAIAKAEAQPSPVTP